MADPPPHLQRHADKRQARRLEHRLQRELDDPGRLGQALRLLGLLGLFLGMAVLGGWLLLGLVGLYSDSFGPLLRPPPEGSARHR